jgi:sugar phosphate isomerase/epimerase
LKMSLSVWSCHKYMYDGSWTNADFIDFAKTAGAEGVELLSVFWNPEQDIPRVQEALSRNGLVMACFGACNNLAVPDEAGRRAQVKDITDSVDMAVLFGAKVVRVFSGDKPEDVTFEQAKEWIISGLKEAASYAESKGVTLCLENHGHFAGKAKQVLEVIEEVNSPALKSTFDTGNFLLVDDNPEDALDQLKSLVAHVHFKDFKKVDESYEGKAVYPSLSGVRYAGKISGEGEVNLTQILTTLKGAGYQDWLTVEFEGDEEQKLGSARSIGNLQGILKTL